MRNFPFRWIALLVLAAFPAGLGQVHAVQKTATFKLYRLSLHFDLSSVYNYNGSVQQWAFTTAGSTNLPLGYTNSLMSTEVSPTSRNFLSGSNTFLTDFIIYDYTQGDVRTASFGTLSMVLPTVDRSGAAGVADGVPDIFQNEVAFQHSVTARAAERYSWGGNLYNGPISVYLSRARGTNLGAYQLRYGRTNNPVIVNGRMSTYQSSGTMTYNAATRVARFSFDGGSTGSSVFTNVNTSVVTIPGFSLPDDPGPNYQVKNMSLSRVGKTYRGIWEFVDGNTQTAYRDLPYNYLVITDNNDTDSDGIPDLSDPFVAPTITAHPQSRTVESGSPVTFSAAASGYPYVNYQWQKNGVAVPGATASKLTLSSAQLSHAGNYRLLASNPAGSALSSVAQLIVCDYTFSPAVPTFYAEGGTTNVWVTASGGCDWTVVNTNAWIQLGSSTGSGSAFVTFTALPSTNEATRLGFLKVGHRWLPVRQLGVLPPASLAGKTLLMTVTNATGDLPADTKLRLWTSAATNDYHASALFSATPLEHGTYTYERTGTSEASTVLSDAAGAFDLQLSFVSPSEGSFLLTDSGGATQTGTFVLNANRADFNGDRLDDILAQNQNRVLWASFMNGTNLLGKARLRNGIALGVGWRVFGVADMNRDNSADVLLQHDTGKLSVWYMNRTNLVGSASLRPASTGWRAVTTSDFNGDSDPDIIFQHTTRKAAIWYMRGTNFLGSAAVRSGVAASTGWNIAGASDFSDDGQSDLLWQHDDGRLAVWHLVGTTLVNSSLLRDGQPAVGWRVGALNDFNDDGRIDFILQNGAKLGVWYMDREVFMNASALPATTVTGAILAPR